MIDNLKKEIKSAVNYGRLSKEVKKAVKELEPFVGTSVKIPNEVKDKVLGLESNSDIAEQMKNYVKNKK